MDEWTTLAASAGLSAVVSAVVSLLAVSQVTVRRARAERADAARQAVKAAVAPLLAELARYQFIGRGEPKRTAEASQMQDHTNVVKVRTAAAELPRVRRWLVDRRCRAVFGAYWTNLARDLPTMREEADSTGTFAAWLTASVKDGEIAKGQGPLDGLMQRAYSQPAGHGLQRKLRRNLRRLAACR